MQQHLIDSMAEIFEEEGVQATPEQIAAIAESFNISLDMEREMGMYQHISRKEECPKCKKLEGQLKELQSERDIYHKTMCKVLKTDEVICDGKTILARR